MESLRKHKVIAFAIAYGIGLAVLLYGQVRDWAYDDPFITFRYAENLARGLGFVYNPGERVLSTTTPLFTLILAVLSHIGIDLPQLANLIGVLSLALGGLSLWDLARTWKASAVGWVGLLLYPSFSLLLSTLGSEMPLYLAFCLGAFAFYARERYHLTALFIALAALTRADGVLVALILAADYLLRTRRPILWSAILTALVVTLPWFIFAAGYFGSPIPATLAAKQHQGSMAISRRFGPGLLTIVGWYAAGWQYWGEAALALWGGLLTIRQARGWRLFLLWPALYFLAYSALGVSGYFWYYAPLVPGFLAASGLGIEALVIRLTRVSPKWGRGGQVIGLAAVLVLAMGQGRQLFRLQEQPDNRFLIYRAVGQWLEVNTSSQASVGALEVGIIGYYARRPMVDFAGLIQPAVAKQLTPTTTYENAAGWAILNYHPAYLVLNPAWFPTLMQEKVLPACLAQQTFAGEAYGYPGELIIYRCDWKKEGSR